MIAQHMTFFDILLWMAGASWVVLALIAVRQAIQGNRSLLAYLGMVAAIAVPTLTLLPGAAPALLGGLWLITLVVPGLLLRWIPKLMWQGRLHTALRLCRLIPFLQPLGPYRLIAVVHRFQCLREIGRTAEANRLATYFTRLPQPAQHQLHLLTLKSEQRWPELISLLTGDLSPENRLFRLRARAETADIAGMLTDFQALAEMRESHPVVFRHALIVVLAFAGQPQLLPPLLMCAASEIQTFWQATAHWAAGDASRAPAQLEALRQPRQPCLDAAITWRLAHPPSPVASLPPDLQQALLHLAQETAAQATRPSRAWFSWAILAVCTGMLIITESDEQPLIALWTYGAVDTYLGWLGNSWRFIAAGFLHANPMHLAMNSLGLLSFGPELERLLGRWRFLLLYLGAGIGGMALVQALSYLDDRGTFVVGASCSIMGLVGAELARIWRNRVPGQAWWQDPQLRRMGLIVGIQVVFDFSHASVSQAGHIGGFFSGLAIGLVIMRRAMPPGTARE